MWLLIIKRNKNSKKINNNTKILLTGPCMGIGKELATIFAKYH
jgi:short-subunit dehydrogenase